MDDDMDAGYESLPGLDRTLTKVECIGVEKRSKPTKHHVYVLAVCWSDGVKYPIYREYISFFDLKICLKEEFKDHPGFFEPELPALKHFERGWLFGNKETATERRKKYINKFCQQVTQLPEDMVRSSIVTSFYETWESDYDQQNQSNGAGRRKSSVPVVCPLPLVSPLDAPPGGRQGRRGSQPQVAGRYHHRDVPDLAELPSRRPRSTSMVHEMSPVLARLHDDSSANSRSLPRGVSLDAGAEYHLDQQYRVTADYSRRKDGEVDLREGQIVEVLERNMTGWWFVHIEGAGGAPEQGWAPGAFLVPVLPDFSQLQRSPSEGTNNSGEEDLRGTYETICDFRAQNEDEVSYTRGQHVQVTGPRPDGWWKIRLEDDQEGLTPAVNLQPTVTDGKAGSNFQKRSLRGRGAPPRSRKAREAASSGQQPLYAQVKRTTPGAVTSQQEDPSTGIVKGDAGNVAFRPMVTKDTPLNYTEVVFNPTEEVSSFTERHRKQKQDERVEYAEINPRPLPKPGLRVKGPTDKQPDEDAHCTYVNVTTSAFKSNHQKVSPSTGVQRTDRTAGQERAADSGKSTTPVPRPRRLGGIKAQSSLPNYENTGDVLAQRRGDHQTPPPHHHHHHHHSHQARGAQHEADEEAADGARTYQNYENHAVAFVTDFIRSTGKQDPRRPMATPDMRLGAIDAHLVHLPAPPAQPAPGLPPDMAIWWSPVHTAETNMIEAACDFTADGPPALCFKKGDLGVLVKKDTGGWLGVKLGERVGWVPTLYWGPFQPKAHTPRRNIKSIKQAEALHDNQSWFLGKISRQEAEDMLLQHGQQRDFLIRESTNRVGDLTLSVRYQDRVRHFPIQMTATGKYDIGKAHFADLTKVVSYYQQNPLFFDELADNAPVSLGLPINRPKP